MKNLTRVLAPLGFVATMVAFVPGVADATTRNGSCETQEACLWEDDNKEGGIFDALQYASNYSDWTYISRNRTLNDSVSSVQNRDTVKALWLYEHSSGGGTRNSTAVGAYDSDLHNDGIEDKASSHCWDYSTAPSWCN